MSSPATVTPTPAPRRPAQIQPDWVSKTLAGLLLGFIIALACSAIFVWLSPGMAPSSRSQLAMWMLAPVWLGVLSLCYLFRTGLRAWIGLGGACLLLGGLALLLRPGG